MLFLSTDQHLCKYLPWLLFLSGGLLLPSEIDVFNHYIIGLLGNGLFLV